MLIGIIAGAFVPDLLVAKLAFAAMCLLLVFVFVWRYRPLVASVLLMVLALLFGYVNTCFQTDRLFEGHYTASAYGYTPNSVMVRIISDPIQKTRSTKIETEVLALLEDSAWKPLSGKLMVYLENDSAAQNLAYGDEIMIHARLNAISSPRNPAEFNYKRYMHFHQISHQAYVPSENWTLLSEGEGLMRLIKGAQHSVIEIAKQHTLSQRELAIISALLVGYKHHLTADQVSAFSSAGAMHVLAVSGLHVGIIFVIVMRFLKPFEKLRWGKWIIAGLALFILWLYAALTGMSPSVTRAATMFTFVIFGKVINRHTDIFNTLSASAVFLLVINPFLVVEVGFQLSYLAVLGIVLLQPRIYDLWKPSNWLLDKAWTITAVSIAAQVATFPLGLLYFHQFPNYFLLSNLVVIPAASAILPAGIALIAFSWVPVLSDILGTCLYYLVHWLDGFIQWVEKLPFALIQGIDINIFETYFIYMIITTSVVFLISKRYVWLVWFLAMTCCIEVLNIVEQLRQRQQKSLVIYDVNKHFAMDLIRGHDHVFIADSAFVYDDEAMRFHVEHNWWLKDLRSPLELKQPNDWTAKHVFMFDSKRILVLRDSLWVDSIGDVEFLVIHNRTVQHPREILRNVRPGKVILTSALDWKTLNYWDNLLVESDIPFYNISESGAFVLALDD